MRVRELDARAAPDGELLALHAIEEACAPPGEPRRPAELALSYYRYWPESELRRRFVAEDDGAVVGFAVLMVSGPAFAFAAIFVAPPHRRRGAGRMLLDTLRAAARAAGAPSFFARHWDEDGAAFARAAGARDDQRDIRSLLDLTSASLSEPVVPAGFRLLSWSGAAPEELVESFARARDDMNDAPTPGEMEFPPTTVADVRQLEQTAAQRGREVRVTVALDERDEIAAFTDLRTSPGLTEASTDDTAVAPWARGRGLGRAVKVESLRRLRADRPGVTEVTTTNAEHNAAMRHINESVGFEVISILTTTVLDL